MFYFLWSLFAEVPHVWETLGIIHWFVPCFQFTKHFHVYSLLDLHTNPVR